MLNPPEYVARLFMPKSGTAEFEFEVYGEPNLNIKCPWQCICSSDVANFRGQ